MSPSTHEKFYPGALCRVPYIGLLSNIAFLFCLSALSGGWITTPHVPFAVNPFLQLAIRLFLVHMGMVLPDGIQQHGALK